MNDDLLNRALIFAVNAHAGMVRKGTNKKRNILNDN